MLVCVYDKINGQEIVSIHLGDGHEESQVSFFFFSNNGYTWYSA